MHKKQNNYYFSIQLCIECYRRRLLPCTVGDEGDDPLDETLSLFLTFSCGVPTGPMYICMDIAFVYSFITLPHDYDKTMEF